MRSLAVATSEPAKAEPRHAARTVRRHGADPSRAAQHPIGNQARLRAHAAAVIQPKLQVGALDDPLEREADAVADRIMREAETPAAVSAASPRISRTCEACKADEEEGPVRRSPAGAQAAGDAAPDLVDAVLASPGRPLDAETRTFFEPRFGADFSAVRLHSGAAAAASARAIAARAYAAGPHIVLGEDAPASTPAGRRLLAHELTHVVQQGAAAAAPIRRDPVATPTPAPDAEEDALYPIHHKYIAGMGPGDKIQDRHLFEWARARGYARVVAPSSLRAMQEEPGSQDSIVEGIYKFLIDKLWGGALNPDTLEVEPEELEGSDNARGRAVFELGEHWEEQVGRFLRGQLTSFFAREMAGAFSRTIPDTALELDPGVIYRIRHKPYGHTVSTNRWGQNAHVGERYGVMHIVDIYNPDNIGSIGRVWFYLSDHADWYYSLSAQAFGDKDPFVAEVYKQVAESTQFAAMLLPLMLKVGAFGLGMSGGIVALIGSVVLNELGEEGEREVKGLKHRSAWEIVKSAGVDLVFAHVMNKVFEGVGSLGREGGEAAELAASAGSAEAKAEAQLIESAEGRAAKAVRKEVGAAEGSRVSSELRAGRARAVNDKALAEEGYVSEVDIVSEGQPHTYRRKQDGSWCRFSTRMCFDPDEIPESRWNSLDDEMKHLEGFQEGVTTPEGTIISDPKEAGRLFNEYNVPEGAASEVQVLARSGRRPRVDLYVRGEEIISRKFPQGQLAYDPHGALDYLQELRVKYPAGAPIPSGAMQGEVLQGIQVLEIPVQHIELPEEFLSYASSRNIVVRDVEGHIYNH